MKIKDILTPIKKNLQPVVDKLDPILDKAGHLANNYIPLGKVGFLKRFQSTASHRLFSPPEMERMYQEYIASIDLADGLKCTDAFETYTTSRVTDLDGLSKIKTGDEKSDGVKTPDGKSMAEKLKIDPPKKDPTEAEKKREEDVKAVKEAVKKVFSEALELDEATLQAREDYEQTIKAMNAVIAQRPPKFNIGGIASYLQEVRKTTTNAIEKQHQKEIAEITKLFDEPSDSLDNIKSTMGLDSAEEIKKFKDDTLGVIKKNHKEELSKLDDTLSAEITNLHNCAQSNRDRISYLAIMYENNAFMKKEIDRLARENQEKNPGIENENPVIALGSSKNGIPIALLQGIKVTDMPIIESITGRKIHYDKDSNTFSMELPNVGLFYYNSFNQSVDDDLRSLAQAIRACGYQKITMTVDYADEKYAMEIGRKQFEACARTGFDPNPDPNDKDKKVKNITIMVNGKEVSAKDLFKDEPKRLAVIRDTYQKDNEVRASYKDNTFDSKTDGQNFKKAVTKERERQQAGDAGKFKKAGDEPEAERPRIR